MDPRCPYLKQSGGYYGEVDTSHHCELANGCCKLEYGEACPVYNTWLARRNRKWDKKKV